MRRVTSPRARSSATTTRSAARRTTHPTSTRSTPAAAARRSAAAPCYGLPESPPARPIDQLIDQLAARGFGVVDGFVEPKLLADLRARCLSLSEQGALRPARIGRGA